MDQTAPETSTVDEGYAAYVEARRERVAREEAEITAVPATMTCRIEMDADVADVMLDLIAAHINKYGVRTQAYLLRASKSIEGGLQEAAGLLKEATRGDQGSS